VHEDVQHALEQPFPEARRLFLHAAQCVDDQELNVLRHPRYNNLALLRPHEVNPPGCMQLLYSTPQRFRMYRTASPVPCHGTERLREQVGVRLYRPRGLREHDVLQGRSEQ